MLWRFFLENISVKLVESSWERITISLFPLLLPVLLDKGQSVVLHSRITEAWSSFCVTNKNYQTVSSKISDVNIWRVRESHYKSKITYYVYVLCIFLGWLFSWVRKNDSVCNFVELLMNQECFIGTQNSSFSKYSCALVDWGLYKIQIRVLAIFLIKNNMIYDNYFVISE